MLRAARQFAPRRGRTLERDVLVTGFSQGASAALGLARALQDGADPWFRPRAVVEVGDRTYGGSRHLGSNLSGTALVVRWFAGLR